jgi:hypothetical protein
VLTKKAQQSINQSINQSSIVAIKQSSNIKQSILTIFIVSLSLSFGSPSYFPRAMHALPHLY